MATILDVAALAEVSTATVSRVVNNSGFVDPILTKRVNDAIGKLNYQPNLIARGLRTQATAVIALVIPDIENPFFTSICRGMEDAANDAGYSVMICNTDEDIVKEKQYLSMLAAQGVAGILISPVSSLYTDIQPLLDRNIGVVSVGRTLPQSCDSVHVDNREGGKIATQHLLDEGYKRIACITGEKSTSSAVERLAGYSDAIVNAEIELDKRYQIFTNFKDEGGYNAAKRLMALSNPPDAIFVTNNRMTAGAFKALQDLNLDIPQNVGLVGFDELTWSEIVSPTVTTVTQPTRQMGVVATKKLLEKMQGLISDPEEILFQAELIIRDSSHKV